MRRWGTNAFPIEEIVRGQQKALARREIWSALNINLAHPTIAD
jgi:hypothetical protein